MDPTSALGGWASAFEAPRDDVRADWDTVGNDLSAAMTSYRYDAGRQKERP